MHFQARLGPQVKLLTVVTLTILFGLIGIFSQLYQSPSPKGHVALAMAMAGHGLLVLSLLSIGIFCKIKRYEIHPGKIIIVRTFDRKEISVDGTTTAEGNPQAFKGAIRKMGLGGFLSISGFYYSKTLGNFKAYVSDPRNAVIVRTGEKTIVISPKPPELFIEQLNKIRGAA